MTRVAVLSATVTRALAAFLSMSRSVMIWPSMRWHQGNLTNVRSFRGRLKSSQQRHCCKLELLADLVQEAAHRRGVTRLRC